jgi:hypothetical protein
MSFSCEMKQPGSVEEMIATLPRQDQLIVKRLRALVKDCLPKAEEKLSYGVPYYRHNRLICFIWPPTVYFGSHEGKAAALAKGVTLGFNYGHLMSNDQGVLLAEGRKQVYVMYLRDVKEIDDALVRSQLFEAGELDDTFTAKKKRSKR